MQKATLIFLLAVTVLSSSCNYYNQQAKQQFYTQILTTNDTLDRMTKEWHGLLQKAMVTNNYTDLGPCRVRIAQFLNTSRPKVANLEISAGAESIRDSEEVFLSNQAIVTSELYPPFESNNDLTPPEVVQNQLKTLGNDLENEIATNEAIKRSIIAFSKKNKLNAPK